MYIKTFFIYASAFTFFLQLLIYPSYIIASEIVKPSNLHAKATFEGNDLSESQYDDEEDFEFDDESEVVDFSINSQEKSGLFFKLKKELLLASRFTYRHEFAYRIAGPQRPVINRSSLRFQSERLFNSKYFVFFDGKLSYNAIYDFRDYPANVSQRYRYRKYLREFYMQVALENISFKIGKQIVIWGEAEGSIAMDVISPRDLTEFIFTPPEDSRIGQVMATVEYFMDNEYFTLILNPDVQVNKLPVDGHEYAIDLLQANAAIHLLDELRPAWSASDMEIGIRWRKVIHSSDLSIMAASVIDDTPVMKIQGVDSSGRILLQGIYNRYRLVGFSTNYARKNILWKAEAGLKLLRTFNKDFSTINPLTDDGLVEKNTFDSALGLEYNANNAYTVTLEGTNRYMLRWSEEIARTRRRETLFYGTWSKNFINDTLKPIYIIVYQPRDKEFFHRFQVKYDITDNTSTTFEAAYFDAEKGAGFLGTFANQNRVYIDITYIF